MTILDTSLLLALFQEQDPQHEAARREYENAPVLRLPAEVFSEFIGILQHRRKFEFARMAAERVLGTSKLVVLDSAPFGAVRSLWDQHVGRLSWVDAAVAWWARELKTTALAFDPRIQKAVQAT